MVSAGNSKVETILALDLSILDAWPAADAPAMAQVASL
jgi:hypothetical protein